MPIIGLLLGAITIMMTILLISRRKREATSSIDRSAFTEYAIPVTKEMLIQEQAANDEVMRLLELSIKASGLFRAEKIPDLVSKLRSGSGAFDRINTKIAFEGDDVLSVDEKRALGLNTRMKYSRTFIEYFDPASLKTIEPKSALGDLHLSAFYRVARRRELIKLRDSDFVRQVEILPVGDLRDCDEIKRFRKIHDIDRVPELPLPSCTAPYCRCMYLPIISDSP